MELWSLVLLALLFFVTSIVGVVTGSNSLITVPVMFQFGIDEKVAVATNMFGLTFMAIGGTIPFVRQGSIEFKKLTPLVILTIVGSAIGALLVGVITNQSIKLMVTIAMIVMVIFTFLVPNRASNESGLENRNISPLVYVLTFLLAIYGGLYSGGYVTVLTASFVALAAMSFSGAVGATKFINVFSSGIATLIFMWQGLVDYRLGIILGIAMFAGAFVGAHYATRMNEIWLKRIFLATVFILAIKMLFDLL
ncbi:MAG: sulfite exporter TauE/SafE family protein [Acidobacteria bacterium]|nr:MAG: sulfite exporter TauE/SafE family protein [Acidobacteriota bacterium]